MSGVAANLRFGLAVYKYTGFLWTLADEVLRSWSLASLPPPPAISLPDRDFLLHVPGHLLI